MSFINIPFLVYFLPVVFILFHLVNLSTPKTKARNVVLLSASLVFYFFLEPYLLPFMLLSIYTDYRLGILIKNTLWEGRSAKKYLFASYFINAGVFVALQVLVTYLRSGSTIFGLEHTLFSQFVMPVGIGIFTLRSIGYVADVYHGYCEAETNLLNLAVYISFFPQLVVGPIVDYNAFRPQLKNKAFNKDLLFNGVCRFVIGLGKKILIANNIAIVSDMVFNLSATSDSITQVPISLAWLGLISFALQIYYDFSAYADMAIGLSNIFGFTAPNDYRYPYASDSMTTFWERWNISIKTWFTRHVARPLNGRRGMNQDQLVVNTFISFILLGFWYRFNVGIFLWAFIQVFFVTVEKVINYEQRSIPKPLAHLYTVLVILLSWALFRPDTLYQMLLFLRNLFGMNHNGIISPLTIALLKEFWVFLLAALIFAFPIAPAIRTRVEKAGKATKAISTVLYPLLLMLVFGLCMLYLARGTYVPYAYFSF